MHRLKTRGNRATPLAETAFRRLWLASMLSAAGDAASWVAMAALVLGAGGSLPLLAVLYTAPVAAGGLAAGWALDRFDRRHLLAADPAVRGAVFAAIPLAAAVGGIGSGQVYATAAIYGLLKMTGLAGFPAMIPQLVGADLLPTANALETAGFGVATVAGPALAGAMLGAGLHPAVVIAADAATYFVLAATLQLTPAPRAFSPAPAGHRQPADAAIGDVIRLAIRHPVIRDTTIMFALFNIGDGVLLHAGVGAAVIGIVTIMAAPALLLAPNLLRSQPAADAWAPRSRADPGTEPLLPKEPA
jgi:MFS family permease